MSALRQFLDRLKSARLVAFPLAVQKRYSADRGGTAAAAIAYYGFLSVFPLLLLAASVIGFVVAGHPATAASLQARLQSALPGFGAAVGDNLPQLERGRAAAGVVGLAGLLWSGTAVAAAATEATRRIFRSESTSNLLRDKLRNLGTTVALGIMALLGVAFGAIAGSAPFSGGLSVIVTLVATCAAVASDAILFRAAYRLLTPGRGAPSSREWPGAVTASVAWNTLKIAGGWYAARTITHAGAVYGTFASTVGLLVILNLAARIYVYGAEINAHLEPAETRAVDRVQTVA